MGSSFLWPASTPFLLIAPLRCTHTHAKKCNARTRAHGVKNRARESLEATVEASKHVLVGLSGNQICPPCLWYTNTGLSLTSSPELLPSLMCQGCVCLELCTGRHVSICPPCPDDTSGHYDPVFFTRTHKKENWNGKKKCAKVMSNILHVFAKVFALNPPSVQPSSRHRINAEED